MLMISLWFLRKKTFKPRRFLSDNNSLCYHDTLLIRKLPTTEVQTVQSRVMSTSHENYLSKHLEKKTIMQPFIHGCRLIPRKGTTREKFGGPSQGKKIRFPDAYFIQHLWKWVIIKRESVYVTWSKEFVNITAYRRGQAWNACLQIF